MTILTPFVLASVVSGGTTLLSNPMLFRFLTSIRYPEACRKPLTNETDRQEIRLASELSGQQSGSNPRRRQRTTSVHCTNRSRQGAEIRRRIAQTAVSHSHTTMGRVTRVG
jgi:hypothetical protein